MKDTARMLLGIAREVVSDSWIVFPRIAGIGDSTYNAIHFELQKLVDRVRVNEGVGVVMARVDDGKEMRIGVALTPHEARDGILRAIGATASKLARRNGIDGMEMYGLLVKRG